MTKSNEDYKLTADEENEIELKYLRIIDHVAGRKTQGEDNKKWYSGITGQKDVDGDGKSDRIVAHRATYKNIDEDTWKEVPVTNYEVAKGIERKLQKNEFDAGDKIQGDDNVDKVYVFRKEKIQAIEKNSSAAN